MYGRLDSRLHGNDDFLEGDGRWGERKADCGNPPLRDLQMRRVSRTLEEFRDGGDGGDGRYD